MNRIRSFTARLLAVALLGVAGVLGVSTPVSAQDISTATTTTAAMTSAQAYVAITSATSVAASTSTLQSYLWIDRELVEVGRDYVAGNLVVPIRRGASGTRAFAHNSGAKVTVLPTESTPGRTHVYQYDPDFNQTCTRGSGQAVAIPWINIATGTTWNCRASGAWVGTNIMTIVWNSDQVFTP